MRRSVVAVVASAGLAAGCYFSSPSAGDDVRTFVDDTAEDFAEPSALVEAVLHARGAIEPETYSIGGLHMTAYPRAIVMQNSTATWAQLETLMQNPPPSGARQGVPPDFEFGNTQPYGVGLARIDNFTLVFRGEIFLDATTTFRLQSDGPALLQIDTDGTYGHQVFDQVDAQPDGTMTVTPPAPGWYPIRAALTDTAADAYIRFRTQSGPIPRDRFRSRTTAAAGLVLEGFEDPLLTTPAGLGIETQDLARDFGTNRPTWDFNLMSPADYSARMRGQVLVETPGAYRFGATVDSDDLVRIWIDGKVVSSKWGPGDSYDASMPLELAAGWHDLVIDVAGIGTRSGFSVEILEGPPGVATGVIPARLLRPVVRTGQLEPFTLGAATIAIPDNGLTEIPLPPASLQVPAGALVQAVDVGYALSHGAPIQATVKLVHPDGTADVLRTNDPTMLPFEHHGARAAFEGKPVPAGALSWKLVVEDNALGAAGSIGGIMVATGYRGGPPPVTPAARFESKPRPFPAEAVEIVDARTIPLAPAGATIAISIRTCATPDACAAAAWQPVAGESAIPAAPFIEYRLELGSDGWAVPSVERVEIDYRVR
jgi:hypothetical protein